MHWADVIAKDIAEKCDKPLIATGISPTGILHVGSLREAITGESVRSAVEALGKEVRLIYIIDDFDPLRRRYTFLPEEFENYVGQPICRIPCPCGKHRNYAHHFIQPFLDAVDSLGMKCDIIWTHELYEQGKFAECIDNAMTKRMEAIQILHDVTGKEADPEYATYNPLCSKCGRFCKPVFDSYKFPYVDYECSCGNKGTADIRKAEGKLVWRLEWPAKWHIFGTSAEPFGKDHASAGGSYESGVPLAEKIYGDRAPFPIPYEFVQLKGVGQMHKSLGSPVTGIDAIKMMPPEVLNYLFLRVNPTKVIDFDSGLGVIDMVEEYDRMERLYYGGEWTESEENSVIAYKLAQHNHISEKMPLQFSYRQLVSIVQVNPDPEKIWEIMGRNMDLSQATDEDRARFDVRVESVKYWLEGFAPESVKFSISEKMPEVTLNDEEKAVMKALSEKMPSVEWNAEAIGAAFNEVISSCGIAAKKAYKATYRVLIGKDAGPRLASFLTSIDKDFITARFAEASQ